MTTRSYSDLSDSATTFDPEEQFDRDIDERMKGMSKEEWQTIETAPKDKPFLVYQPGGQENWEIGMDLVWFEPSLEAYTMDGNMGMSLEDYTHWRPLPAPPTSKGE
jgi:hypothetical protein